MSWTLAFNLSADQVANFVANEQTYQSVIDSLTNKYQINQIILFAPKQFINEIEIEPLFDSNQIQIRSSQNRLQILDQFLSNKQNIILISQGRTLTNLSTLNIVANQINLTNADPIYQKILAKFGINTVIDSNAIAVPYTPENAKFIKLANETFNKLVGTNDEVRTNLALTIMQNQLQTPILSPSEITDPNSNNTLVSIYNPNYIYYPFFRMSIDPISSSNQNSIIDTNGQLYQTNSIYDSMVPTADPNSGILVRKSSNKPIIPKILHLINLSDPNQSKYAAQWKSILREPWSYQTWTLSNLKSSLLKNTRLGNIFDSETDPNIKYLVAIISILEKYGGIAVNSDSIPLKLIPDELLTNKFVIGFANDLDLSTRFVGSIPQHRKSNRVLEKINNALSINSGNDLQRIFQIIRQDPNTTIYPNYYFDPNSTILPKKLLNCAICINLYKNRDPLPTHTKTDLNREYNVTSQSIIAKLSENPKNRFLNSSNQ